MKKRISKYLVIIGLIATLFTDGIALAGIKAYTGTIQGANCVIHDSKCPTDASDPHIALEQNFVLLVKKGNFYFLPNIERSVKTRYLGREVRIKGDLKGEDLVVSEIAVKYSGSYRTVWNWKDIMNNIDEGGRN